jgi:predicted ABC-type ATPase
MPQVIIIAGPNGAGKTSFANEYLSTFRGRFAFINADEIAREMIDPGLSQATRDLRAGREMLMRIRDCVDTGVNVLFETTLATLTYASKVPRWRQAGYSVGLVYLRLANVQMSLDRVRRRVAAGGHDVPEATVRRRFSKSLEYFENHYKTLVDEWYVWDSLEGSFQPAEKWDD